MIMAYFFEGYIFVFVIFFLNYHNLNLLIYKFESY